MKMGNIIFLNGTSSSGKSTLAKALQTTLNDDYLNTGIDHFLMGMPEKAWVFTSNPDAITSDKICGLYDPVTKQALSFYPGKPFYALAAGLYRAVETHALNGLNVIVDDIIFHPHILQLMVNSLVDLPTWFVNVFCPKDEAIKREKERGDRFPGTVEMQFDLIHTHGQYDLIVNTAEQDIETCVGAICAMLNQPPRALKRLKEQFST